MKHTITIITATPLRSGATAGILTFVNDRGIPGTAKCVLSDNFCPGEKVEVEFYERRLESVNVPETWAKRLVAPLRTKSYEGCLVRAAVDLVIHSTPPGSGVDFDQLKSVVTALEVALVSPR